MCSYSVSLTSQICKTKDTLFWLRISSDCDREYEQRKLSKIPHARASAHTHICTHADKFYIHIYICFIEVVTTILTLHVLSLAHTPFFCSEDPRCSPLSDLHENFFLSTDEEAPRWFWNLTGVAVITYMFLFLLIMTANSLVLLHQMFIPIFHQQSRSCARWCNSDYNNSTQWIPALEEIFLYFSINHRKCREHFVLELTV